MMTLIFCITYYQLIEKFLRLCKAFAYFMSYYKIIKNLTIKNGTVRRIFNLYICNHYMDSQNEIENKVKFLVNLKNTIQNKKKVAQKFILNEGLYILVKKINKKVYQLQLQK